MAKASGSKVPDATDRMAGIQGEQHAINYERLVRMGDYLAQKNGTPQLDGIDAVHFYVMNRYHWLPGNAATGTAGSGRGSGCR